MPEQSSFPPKWTCDSDDKKVRVELRIPNELDARRLADPDNPSEPFTWIEIPTTSVEQWVEKGSAAQIQRTAKVRFPTEWGQDSDEFRHNSPRQLVEAFNAEGATNPFLMARVHWEQPDGTSVLQHFGWVGGVGASGQENVSKFWIYDLSELLSGVTVGETFNNPSVKDALEKIARLTNDNTPIPLSGVTIIPPDSEEEAAQFVEKFTPLGEDDIDVPLTGRDIKEEGQQTAATAYYSLGELNIEDEPTPQEQNFSSLTVGTGDIPAFGLDTKSFVSNHDTLLDVYDWFEQKTSAKLHFEPRENSVMLVADIVPERRVFADTNVVETKLSQGNFNYRFHELVRVRSNDALYEMKPLNTLSLRGSTSKGLFDEATDLLESAGEFVAQGGVLGELVGVNSNIPAEKYPVVKVQVPLLVEAAEGVELSPEVVESDVATLDNAEREARRELAKLLEESTEGEIILTGAPKMMPFDALDAFEVCDDRVFYEQQPVRYEVESVKHTKKATDAFKTRIKVSIWANDSNMETVRKTFVEVDK